MFTVYDDCLPKCLVDEIYNSLSNHYIPWHFTKNIAKTNLNEPNEKLFGFGYNFFRDYAPEQASPLLHVVKPIPFIFSAVGILPADFRIKHARTFLQTPSPGLVHNDSHVDGFYPHTVLLYYVNDTDGDTVFFGEKDNLEPIGRVSPKKGRVVIFDGSIYHSSSAPSSGYRIVVNFNLVSPEHFEVSK